MFAFVYSTCRDTCPAQVQTIRGALDDVGRDVRVIGISVDPANDTPQAGAGVPAQAEHDRPDGLPDGHAASELAPVWKGFAIQPQQANLEHSAHTVLADARGLQRVGFPFDHLTAEAPRPRSRTPVSGHFEALSFVGEWRPVPARRAGRVREGPPARPQAHPHRRAARLGQDAARRRADPARRQARARARAQPGHPAAVAARGRRSSRARPRRSPAPTRSSRSRACPTRRCASSRTRRSCSAGSRSRAGPTSARPPPA